MGSAKQLLQSARRELTNNPEAAFILAYDAARKASTGLLAQQGLRARNQGHHLTVQEVVTAQFGGPFSKLNGLRIRRAEIEYPRFPGDEVSEDECQEAITDSTKIVDAAEQLVGSANNFQLAAYIHDTHSPCANRALWILAGSITMVGTCGFRQHPTIPPI